MTFDGRVSGRLTSRLAKTALALSVFVVVALLYVGGYLNVLEYGVGDFRDRHLRREVQSDIVVVGLDSASLRELGQWPWPREYHARLLDRLREAAPARLFLDFDFSSNSGVSDDAALAASLSNWRAARPESPVILPVFVQPATGAESRFLLTQPLDQFARHAVLGSVNQQPAGDGLVRSSLSAITFEGRQFPSAVAQLANSSAWRADQSLPIDFSIAASSFGFVSYSDLLSGRVPIIDLKGKTVLVGATAIELGDMLSVPVYRSLPGVVVQALALQTAREGAVYKFPLWGYLSGLAIWTLLCTALFSRLAWRANLLVLLGAFAAITVVMVYAHAGHRIGLDAVPPALTAFAAFLAVTLSSLDEHIKARQAQRRRLEFQAKHDALTELPNRIALDEHLKRVLPAVLPGESVALLMLDLCRFKEVNDTLGHNVGDRVLCEVARRFRECIDRVKGNDARSTASAFIARIGGDEFTVVLDRPRQLRVADELAQSLQESLHDPIDAAGIALDVGLSIGIAQYPQDAQDAQALLKHADVAMYLSKRHSVPFEYYDPAKDEHSVRKLGMVTELRAALANRTIQMFYQPQVDLRTNRVIGAEALMRWSHPTLGAVSPGEFIPVAEATDLIRPLTEWSIVEALKQIARLRTLGMRLRIAVNLSARILQDSRFPQRLRELLTSAAIEPDLLELEITESAMMLDVVRAQRTIRELHAIGVLISVDDYGTGFSSLSYLRDLPIHAIKLDKSFVLGLKDRKDNRVIVESTAQMARALGLRVIAEGAETPWHARFLASAGYDYAQGYCYSQALAPEPLVAWIEDFQAGLDLPLAAAKA